MSTDPSPASTSQLLSRLLAIADDAVVVTDDAHRIVLYNGGAARIFGHPAEAVIGGPLNRLLPPALRDVHGEHLAAFAASPCPSRRMGERGRIQGLRADGTLFDAEASISHVELDGRTFLAAIVRDVSQARESERALKASEARFRGLAAAVPVTIFEANADGEFTLLNERWHELTGQRTDAALGRGWLQAVHPAERERMAQAWQQAVAQRAALTRRIRLQRPDRDEAWGAWHAVPSVCPVTRIAGYLGTVTDVTDAHRQATALERARSEAEAATRAKGLFLANMSHEIRTPLNAVLGMTALLLDTPMTDDQRDFAQTIRASGNALLAVISDILDYSKADVGRLELEQQPFDLRQCIEESLDLVAPRAMERGLNLACVIEEGTPEALVGDAARVRQILVNLLSNAVKFTHRGEVVVGVDGEPIDVERHRIRLAVRDTGIGIPAEQMPRLFQSFTQIDASTTRKYGGTGLGLAISQRLAELMDGRVHVRSEPGQGSVFVAELVLGLAVAREPDFLRADAPALRGRRILIVDDNQTNRRILTQFALRWGMEAATFASAPEALDRVRHGAPFDVAVLDMNMPDMDGLALADAIRRHIAPLELPIVLLTSLGRRQAALGDSRAGLAACLSKPIKAALLHATLVAVLGGRRVLSASCGGTQASVTQDEALRILVAEDHRINQRVVQRLLHHLGHEADVVDNGCEVLDATAQRSYDLVLMDIQMPELDGVDTARLLVARRGDEPAPRIVAMTANAMPGDRERYLDAGMDGYLAKPVDLAELRELLRQTGRALRGGETAHSTGLDLARLEHLRTMQDDDQPHLVRDLIDLFVTDAPQQINALRAAAEAADHRQLRALAHRLLSATQNIGATVMSALCAEVERHAHARDVAAAAQLLDRLDHERQRAAAALVALRLRY